MDGSFGFRVQVQEKTLTTGKCRVKPSTVATVIGSQYVSAAADGPVNLTLTDKSDSSEWQVQLTWDGVKHYVVTGLKPWLAHCSTNIGEAIEIFKGANDVLLVRREASTTASAPAGQDAIQQQPASQRAGMPVSECATEGEAATARPAIQHTGGATAAPVHALHAAGSQALPPAPAAAAPPAEGVQGAQAGPSMPELRSYCATASHGSNAPARGFSGFTTGLASAEVSAPPDPDAGSSVAARYPSGTPQAPTATFAWHPGALPATYAAVAVPQHPVPVVSVPWGHGGCGGSGGPPATAELYGHAYGGAPLRPVDVNQRPFIANQQGPATGVAGMQGSTGQGYEDGLRLRGYALHPGHLLAAAGVAAGTAGGGIAAGSGACGSGAAAGAAARGYDDAPVEGASPPAFRPDCARAGSPLGPLAEGVGCPQSEGGGRVPGAEDPRELWRRGGEGGKSGGGQPPAARAPGGASAFGTCSGGGPSEVAGLAAPDAQPGDTGTGVAMRAVVRRTQICLRRRVAAALWPGLTEQMPVNQPHEVLLHTVCIPAAAQLGQPDSRAQQQKGELHVHPVKLVLYGTASFRLTGVKAAVTALGVSDPKAVGLRRLPCGRVLLERWWQQGQGQEGEDMQRAGAGDEGLPLDEAEEGGDREYVSSPKRRRLQGQGGGGAGAGVAMRAYMNGSKICLRQHVAAALWPGLTEQMRENQPQQVLLHTGCTPIAARQTDSGAEQQEEALRVYPVKLVLYWTGFRLAGIKAAVTALGVGDKEAVGLRRLPCGRVLLERWQKDQEWGQGQQGQGLEGEDMGRAGAQGDEVAPGEAEGGSDGEDFYSRVPSPKRRRLQGLAPGGSGTAASGPEAAGPETSNITTKSCPRQLPAPAAEAQAWDVRIARTSLLPPAAAARQLWPLEAAALKENQYPDHTVPVTLLTAACNRAAEAVAAGCSARTQQVGGGQGPAEQHTVLLQYTAMSRKFRVKEAAGAIAALGLRDGDMLRLRGSSGGRTWAERVLPSAAQQQPHPALAASASPPAAGTAEWVLPPAVNSAHQQPAPALAPPAAGTAAAVPTPSTAPPALQQTGPGLAAASTAPAAAAQATDANSPLASPALSPDAPHPLLCFPAAPTTTATTGPLCVSGGYLHPARPTVAALWPECVDMPVGTQQLIRMRAVVEPGGGGDTAAAAAGPNASLRRSVTHYGTQLARLAGGAWRLEGTHALLRELRLGEGDRVELVPLEGGVVGVQRQGTEEAEAAGAGQSGASG